MYNEQIEGLISAALADGELTEKEKQILFKRAESMGIDLDEFEMVLDARLVELKKEEARQSKEQEIALAKAKAAAVAQPAAPKSTKYGDIRKCPSCGAMVPAFKVNCPECGHEFTGIKANSSVEKLAAMLLDVEKKDTQSETGKFLSYMGGGVGRAGQQKREIISSFPIPKTREDLLEFITFLAPKAKKVGVFSAGTPEDLRLYPTYRKKLEEVLIKAKLMLSKDEEAMALIESSARMCKIKLK